MTKQSKTEWYKDQNGFIKGALIADAADWVNTFGYDSITYLDLNGEAHELKTTGRDRGKVAYLGSIHEAINGKPYVTVTVINQRASVPNESYTGSNEVVDRLWDDYQSNNSTPKKHKKRALRPQPVKSKEKVEAAQKKRNVLKDKALYGRLSNDPQGNQAAYLIAKGILGFIPRGKVRYGTDKHGDFAAIQLFNIKGEFVGLQRFYDRDIKGRDTNKDFTWGLVKSGACHILGDIDKDYDGIAYICEGYADGVVSYGHSENPTFIALDAYNLDAVAQAIKSEYPKAQGVVICDNDAYKYGDGIDNIGVLRGIEAAKKAGYRFVIPDFSSHNQFGKPKDLWDLWQLGGDQAVVDLLNAPKKTVEDEGFTWDYLGLKSLLGAMKNIAQKAIKLANPQKAIETVTNALAPHSERLDINVDKLSEHAKDAADNALLRLKKRIVARYKGRLATPNQTVNIQRDLNGIGLDHKTMVIQSGLGTGKTQWIKDVVLAHKDVEDALVVLPRITLAKSSSNRLEAANYEDIKSASPQKRHDMDTRRIVSVSNSLELLEALLYFPVNKQFDVVVLDEVELNIHHLFGNTFSGKERAAALEILKRWVKNARYVICAQAQITPLTLDFLKDCGRSDIHVIRNDYQRYKELSVDLFAQKADCRMQLDEWIEQGKPVIVPCTSAKFARGLAKELHEKYPKLRILEIDRDNANEPKQAKFLADSNGNLKNWDVVVHSPSLEQGVSIDTPHFKNVVGFCDAGEGICAPDSFVQMMFRSRHLDKVAIHVDPRIEDKPTDYKQYLAEQANRYNTVVNHVEPIEGGQHNIFITVTDDVILAAKAQAATQATKNRTQEEVYAILVSMGCDITIKEHGDKDNDAGVEALKSATHLQKLEYNERVANAPLIMASQCQEIKESTKATLDENYMVKRHQLERELAIGLDQLDEDEKIAMFDLWGQGKVQKTLNALGQAVLKPMHAIAVARHYLETQPQNSTAQGFWIQWFIRAGILETLGVKFIDGTFVCSSTQWLSFEDLKATWWWQWALEYRDAINGAGLGARIRKGELPDKAIISCINGWIRSIGLSLSSKTIDLNWCQKNDGFVTCLAVNILKNKQEASDKNDRPRIKVYQVNFKANPLFDVLSRRFEAGTMPYAKTADDYLEAKAQDDASTGIQPQNQNMPKPIESERFMARRLIQNGILDSLHIKLNDAGIYECEPEFMFTYKDLKDTSWYQWACEHKEVVNNADLGGRISGKAPSDKVLGLWIRALGIKVAVTKIDRSKLLDIKGEIFNPTETVACTTSTRDVVHTTKHAGVKNKSKGKRELIRAYKINPKSMKNLMDTMGIKEPAKPDDQIDQPMPSELAPIAQDNNVPSPQSVPVDVPYGDEPPIEFYAQYALDDLPALVDGASDGWERPTKRTLTPKTPQEIAAYEVFAEIAWIDEARGKWWQQ
ncbi:MAG: plasmid replication protein, CyRepA1 family [Pseudomonadota bacterium]